MFILFLLAFEFGVLNAMTGVRKMLGLIWSKEQTIKDAVVDAYRRLYINVKAPNERSVKSDYSLHVKKKITTICK